MTSDKFNKVMFEFTEKQWEALGLTLETANSQHNDDGAWTDIMFRAKYNFIDSVKAFLNTQHIHLYQVKYEFNILYQIVIYKIYNLER